MQLEFMLIEVVSDVGIREDTVHEALKILRVRNNEFPVADRYSDDSLAEKLLKMIMNASSYLSLKAQTELDAAEGVPGAPGVREHQLAVPAAGGPRPRNLNGIVVAFHALWSAAFKGKRAGFEPRQPVGSRVRVTAGVRDDMCWRAGSAPVP